MLTRSLADVRLRDVGYEQTEWACSGHAESYRAPAGLPTDGRWTFEVRDRAEFTTRVLIRRPSDEGRFSGTVVVEWLNVSSGSDSAPVFGFSGPELTRAGHVWVGVSAQWAGIVAAPALVDVGASGLVALQSADPLRYGSLVHPGDAYAYDVFTQVVDSLLEDRPEPLDDLDIQRVVAVGESQSAYALVTYVNGVQPRSERFDGFLIHSRGRGALPLGDAGRGADVEGSRGDPPVLIRDDLDVPVLVLQTETDVLGFLDSLSCRQPDTGRFRCWEVAGAAHADLSLIGELETMLGCADPVNRGQQRFVVRSALRHLVDWAGTGTAPPSASPLAVAVDESGSTVRRRFETDELGNVLGGVRTPCVDAAVETLSGLCRDGESHVCQLFGRRLALPDAVLRDRYPTLASYREAYTAATDRAIDDGFILGDDRDEVLEDAPADVITW